MKWKWYIQTMKREQLKFSNLEEIYEYVAQLKGRSPEYIKEVFEGQFLGAKEIMKQHTGYRVRLPYLGSFEVNPRRVQALINRIDESDPKIASLREVEKRALHCENEKRS